MQPSILKATDLKKTFRHRTAVSNVSLVVEEGEIVGLLGPNGAGKTTTFRIITGEIEATGGAVFLDEKEITREPMYKRARLGISYLPQEPSAFRGLTAEENILLPLQMNAYSKLDQRARLGEVLDGFDLRSRARIKARDLSGGERRRLEVARAFALHPRFILLDEPFAGVDPIAVEELQKLVHRLKEEKVGVLITDHNVHETLEITDRAYIIYEGKILVQGNPQEIISHERAREIFLGEKFHLRISSNGT
jgi:lipopolysaccharide export system ATP-binding protein